MGIHAVAIPRAGPMIRRTLGRGGPEVSPVGLGAMSFVDFYGPTDEAQSYAVLDAAIEAGVDHIDTSDVYGMGRSERVIGRYLERYRGKGSLPFRIATKAGIARNPETGARGFDNSAAYLEARLDASLERLQLDRVDLFYVHRRDPRIEIEEVTDGLARLVASGRIGGFGFSEIAPTSLERAAARHQVAAVQSEYSLQTRLPELGLTQRCAAHGTALVAFSPVGRGLLSDTPPTAGRVDASDFLRSNPRFIDGNLERNVAASAPLRELAAEAGEPTAALAIAWLLAQGPHVLAIPGTRDVAHFRELVRGMTMTMGDELRREIDARLPVGWAHGARYSAAQAIGPEAYC